MDHGFKLLVFASTTDEDLIEDTGDLLSEELAFRFDQCKQELKVVKGENQKLTDQQLEIDILKLKITELEKALQQYW